jgi:hypothetical protein
MADYIVSNGRVISKYWISKDLERSSRSLFEVVQIFGETGKLWKASHGTVFLPTKIQTGHLLNTSWKSYHYSQLAHFDMEDSNMTFYTIPFYVATAIIRLWLAGNTYINIMCCVIWFTCYSRYRNWHPSDVTLDIWRRCYWNLMF